MHELAFSNHVGRWHLTSKREVIYSVKCIWRWDWIGMRHQYMNRISHGALYKYCDIDCARICRHNENRSCSLSFKVNPSLKFAHRMFLNFNSTVHCFSWTEISTHLHKNLVYIWILFWHVIIYIREKKSPKA